VLRHLLLDLDGVLTDGKQYIGPDGEKMFKAFHTRDIRAIRFFVSRGVGVTIVTADGWSGAGEWAYRTGADLIVTRNKMNICKHRPRLNLSEAAFIGDDLWDLELLHIVQWPVCPLDAHRLLHEVDGIHVVDVNGGQGVVSRYLDTVMSNGLVGHMAGSEFGR